MFSINRFQQLLQQLPQAIFEQSVREHQADKHNKGFDRWQHLKVMIYAQFSGASSLRTLCATFNGHANAHYHLGMQKIKRATLADANRKTNPQILMQTLQALMSTAQRRIRKEMAPVLHLLDSTGITLKGPHFDAWTFASKTRHTQGLKLHVLYDSSTQAPLWCEFSAANVNDVQMVAHITLQAGRHYVFDKGYCSYAWWHDIDKAGAFFVTRLKSNAAVVVDKKNALGEDCQQVLADELVRFKHRHSRGGHVNVYEKALRRITVARDGKKRPLVLATNDLSTPAQEIAQHYKARWGVELFFKWIKQHLRIKRFLGRSENAVKIQVLTALIAYLLVVLYQRVHAPGQSLWLLLSELSQSLFQRPMSEQQHRSSYQRRRRCRLMMEKQGDFFA